MRLYLKHPKRFGVVKRAEALSLQYKYQTNTNRFTQMINDVDIMKQAINDARNLYFLRDGKGKSINGITRSDGNNDHYYSSNESSENQITKLAIVLFKTRIKLLDRGVFKHILGDTNGNIELDKELEEGMKQLVEERSWALLEKELGTESFNILQKTGSIRLLNNGMYFTLTLKGEIIIEWEKGTINRHHKKGGYIRAGNYHIADSLATLVKWIKTDPELVFRNVVEGCGNINIKGGELS